MNNDRIYQQATDSGDFTFARHNPTDFARYRDTQAEIEGRALRVEQERRVRERLLNLQRWDNSLPPRWSGASLANMADPAAAQATDILVHQGPGSFFITGAPGSGKTHLAHAIVRKLIGAGKVSPSQVKIVSEEALMALGFTGYVGRNQFEEFFSGQYQVFLLDNVGGKPYYDEKREAPLWDRLMDHIHTNSLLAIYTSNGALDEFASILNGSGAAKLLEMVGNRSLAMGCGGPTGTPANPAPRRDGANEAINRHFND